MSIPELFTAKRDHCRALLALSRRQGALIASEHYAELLAVLREKQSLLEQLDALKRMHAAAFNGWSVEREHLAPPLRTHCEELLEETESLLAELVDVEEASTNSLVERKHATGRELASISDGSRVTAAYHDNLAPASHRHLDLDT